MEVKGTIQLFVSVRGNARFYQASVSRKAKDGTYTHASIDVEFGKENFPAERLAKLKENVCYTLDVKSGFLTATSYQDKAGIQINKVLIHISDADFTKSTEVNVKPKQTKLDI